MMKTTVLATSVNRDGKVIPIVIPVKKYKELRIEL